MQAVQTIDASKTCLNERVYVAHRRDIVWNKWLQLRVYLDHLRGVVRDEREKILDLRRHMQRIVLARVIRAEVGIDIETQIIPNSNLTLPSESCHLRPYRLQLLKQPLLRLPPLQPHRLQVEDCLF